jgi:hypothetical protein
MANDTNLPPVPPPNRFYGVFDAQGAPQGFYNNDIYPPKEDGSRNDAIPAAAVEITEAQWTELLAGQPFTRFVGGAVTHITPPPVPPMQEPDMRNANARLDAGVAAALDVALVVKAAMTALPDTFSAQNFIAMKIQLDALTELVASMLQAQADLPAIPGKPDGPAGKPP